MIIGLVAGVLCQEGTIFVKKVVNVDDTLDVFAVHGLGGIFGTIMIAILSLSGFDNGSSLISQLGGIVIVGIYTIAVSSILIVVIRIFIPLRVSEEIETEGLDLSVHGEKAYDLGS